MVHSDLRAEAKDVRGKGKKTEVGEKRVVASWVLLVKECAWGYYPFTSVSVYFIGWISEVTVIATEKNCHINMIILGRRRSRGLVPTVTT
uniref:Uncharacterized protein n=1 Tax=Wuchereria bancrofti TaxID=6293 RepID=A0AAF5PKR4_WUCBA